MTKLTQQKRKRISLETSKKKAKKNKSKRVKSSRGLGLETLATLENAKSLGIFAIKNADNIGRLGNSIASWVKSKKTKPTLPPPPSNFDKKSYTQYEIDTMPVNKRMELYNKGII
jgi:hypothetical protein